MENLKYEITQNIKHYYGRTLHQIKALDDIVDGIHVITRKGSLGGWIERESNLSQKGCCWIYEGYAMDNCKILNNAIVLRKSVIKDNAIVNKDTRIDDSIIEVDSVITNATVFSSRISGVSYIKNANIDKSKIISSDIVGNSYTERIKVPCDSIIEEGNINGEDDIISIRCPTSFLLTNYYDKKTSDPFINITLYFDKNDDILLFSGLTDTQTTDSEILRLLFSFKDNSLSKKERILFSFLLDSYNKIESSIKTETNCLINYLSKNVEDFKKKTANIVDLLTTAQMVFLVFSIPDGVALQDKLLNLASINLSNRSIKDIQDFCCLNEDIIKKISMPVPDFTADSIWFPKVKDSIDAFGGNIIK